MKQEDHLPILYINYSNGKILVGRCLLLVSQRYSGTVAGGGGGVDTDNCTPETHKVMNEWTASSGWK